ncbi:MAG: tetratricopeptide repeat protein [Cellvibrionaceae bacterium]
MNRASDLVQPARIAGANRPDRARPAVSVAFVYRAMVYFAKVCLAMLCLATGATAAVANEPGQPAESPTEGAATGSDESLDHVVSQRESLNDYQNAIARLEAEQGAWGSGLAEQLGGLGRTYQLRGHHRDAIEIFERAIHISRVNNGLYDLSQVPIVEDMLESLMARGLWEEVHQSHQYLYWLHKRNYGAQDPRMLPVIDRIGKWYISDYALNPNRRVTDQLLNAYDLFEHAISIITGTYGQEDLRMIEPLRGLVMSNWYFASFRGNSYLSPSQEHAFRSELSASTLGRGLTHEQTPNQLGQRVRNSYLDGKRAIEKMVEIYTSSPNAPPGAAANAKVELADWQQLFGKYRLASDLYREAYLELMADAATPAQVEKRFSRPVALPELDFVESDIEQPAKVRGPRGRESAEPIHYVLVSFNVNRFGTAERIDILESRPEDDVGRRTRVKHALESTRFRPRLVNGEPVDTEGLTQRYVFTSD